MCPSRDIPTPSFPDDDLLKTFLELDTPPGYRAELINREIVVVPPPDGHHETTISRIGRAIDRHTNMTYDFLSTKGLVTPLGHFIPDLTVAPVDTFVDAPPWADCDGVELVCEITSSDPHHDRVVKRRGYAQAGIPLYLLIDREQQVAVLHSDPSGVDYETVLSTPFDKQLALPSPFGFPFDADIFR